MRGPVRRAIDDGRYTLSVVWEKLDVADRNILLAYIQDHTDYKQAHMGMLPLMALSTIFEAIDSFEYKAAIGHRRQTGRWPVKRSTINERIRTTIWLEISRRVKLDERLAKQRAKERRTV